jgi:bacterioferritin
MDFTLILKESIMSRNQPLIQALSEILNTELAGKNLFFLHHRMQENWGYQYLSSHSLKCYLQALRHSYQLMERIMLIGKSPLPYLSEELRIGQTCEELLSHQYMREIDFSGLLRTTITLCVEYQDNVSEELLSKIYTVNTQQIDWLETQFQRISDLSLDGYLDSQLAILSRRAGDISAKNHLYAHAPGKFSR